MSNISYRKTMKLLQKVIEAQDRALERAEQLHEETKKDNERMRKEQEAVRKEQEMARKEQEMARKEQEAVRKEYEERTKKEQEAVRKEQEMARKEQEAVRKEQEMARKEQEADRKEYEERTKKEQEMARKEQEAIRKEYEERTRKEQEAARKEHEKAKRENDEAWRKLRQDFERFGISQGEQIEAVFVDLGTKFNDQGFHFPKEAEGRVRFLGKNRQVLAEVDKLLENGEVMMAVEVKSKLKKDDVDGHIERLGILSQYNKVHNDQRKVLGAVAGGVVADNVRSYAQSKGLYVIVRNGNSVDIAPLPKNFVPKSW